MFVHVYESCQVPTISTTSWSNFSLEYCSSCPIIFWYWILMWKRLRTVCGDIFSLLCRSMALKIWYRISSINITWQFVKMQIIRPHFMATELGTLGIESRTVLTNYEMFLMHTNVWELTKYLLFFCLDTWRYLTLKFNDLIH